MQSCRQLFGNPGAVLPNPSFPLAHPYVMTMGWSLLILAVFVPLAVRQYNRRMN